MSLPTNVVKKALQQLLPTTPQEAPIRDPRWATVTQLTPLRVRFDGEDDEHAATPTNLVGPLILDDRVWTCLVKKQRMITHKVGGTSVPVGTVQMWAGSSSAPEGWLVCDGSGYSPETYPKLFATISNAYGGTVGAPLLPNLKGRIPVGQDAAQGEFDTIGEAGGEKTVALTEAQLAAHAHALPNHVHSIAHDHGAFTSGAGSAHSHGPGTLSGYYRMRTDDDSGSAARGAVEYLYSAYNSNNGAVVINAGATATESAHTHSIDVPAFSGNSGDPTSLPDTETVGTGAAHNNLQPYLVMRYIIRAT